MISEEKVDLLNERLSNNTINNTMYLLSGANSFLFTVKDADLSPYQSVYLTLNRWYPDLDEYKIVEMAKTDDKGQTVMKIDVEDVDYRIGVYHTNGSLIYLASPMRLVCIASPCSYSLIVPDDAGELYENWLGLDYSLDYNETTKIFTFIYNDPSQDTSEITLNVWKERGDSSNLICTDTSTGYTGVLLCNVSAYSGMFRAVASRTASPETPIVSRLFNSVNNALSGVNGMFITLIIMILLVMIGVVSPILTIILSILAFIPAIVFGIIPLSIGIIIAVAGVIVIHFMKRSVGR